MRDSLDLPSSTSSSPLRRTAAPQLLIEMTAESAARLLVRSLVDQVTQLAASATADAPSAPLTLRPDAWREATERLSTSAALYSAALTGSISKKLRRRLREMARGAERFRQAEAQSTRLGQFARPAARPSTKRLARDLVKLQRLSKALGVYTTAVRLDDMPAPRSFGALTGELVRAEADRLHKTLGEMNVASVRSVRRAVRAVRRLVYLLEPVRVHVSDAAAASDRLVALGRSIERLADLAAVADSLVRSGRRAGAVHMTSVMRAEVFGAVENESGDDTQSELMALARKVRAEMAPLIEQLDVQWKAEQGVLSAELQACAARLLA